jgi:hypothetical protein
MGKAMINGQVLYRDIFDHRGPLLYFLYGLAYLLSNTSLIGVFILEVLSFSIFLFFSCKILLLYLDDEYALLSIPIIAAVVLNLKSFTHGGSPEEFCLPLIAIGLYHLLAYFKEVYPEPMPYKWLIINGFLAGCVLWVKFSLLGFWFGWMLSILIILLKNKEFLTGIKSSLVFLSGMLLATLPWLIYFGINRSIPEWINSYFVINLINYSKSISLLSSVTSTIEGVLYSLIINPVAFGILFFGMIVFMIFDKFMADIQNKLGLFLPFIFLALSVFGGGRLYIYYFLIFSPFIILGFVVVLTYLYEKFSFFKFSRNIHYLLLLVFLTTIVYTIFFHHNIDMLKIQQEELVQYKFESIINQTNHPTLLNYGVWDFGFYTTTGIVPNIRFFYNPNIEYSKFPLIMDEQNRYIQERLVDYVVTLASIDNCNDKFDIPFLYDNYALIGKEIQMYEGYEYCFFLFKGKDLDH